MSSLGVCKCWFYHILKDRQNKTNPTWVKWPERPEVLHVHHSQVWQSFEVSSFYFIGSIADHFSRHSVCWFNWIWKSWFCPPALGNVLLPAQCLEGDFVLVFIQVPFFPSGGCVNVAPLSLSRVHFLPVQREQLLKSYDPRSDLNIPPFLLWEFL